MVQSRKMHLEVDVAGPIDAIAIISLKGGLLADTGPFFRETVVGLVDGGTLHLVLNVREVDSIDTTGISVLVGAINRLRARHGTVSLVAPTAAVQRVLDITKLSHILQVFRSDNEAIRFLESGWKAG